MSLKKSIMLSDETLAAIESRKVKGADDVLWSQSVNSCFEKTEWVIKHALPELTGDEWQMLFNVYAGCWLNDFMPPYRIASDMMDDAGAISLDELNDDYAALVKKVHGFSQVEQFAITEVIQKFWCGEWNDYKTLTDIVNAIVGK